MKLLLLLPILVNVACQDRISTNVKEVWGNLTEVHNDECIELTNANPLYVQNMLIDVHAPDERSFHCYIHCIYQKLDMIFPNGDFDKETILRKATYLTRELTDECIGKAANEKEPCEKSYVLLSCIIHGLERDKLLNWKKEKCKMPTWQLKQKYLRLLLDCLFD